MLLVGLEGVRRVLGWRQCPAAARSGGARACSFIAASAGWATPSLPTGPLRIPPLDRSPTPPPLPRQPCRSSRACCRLCAAPSRASCSSISRRTRMGGRRWGAACAAPAAAARLPAVQHRENRAWLLSSNPTRCASLLRALRTHPWHAPSHHAPASLPAGRRSRCSTTTTGGQPAAAALPAPSLPASCCAARRTRAGPAGAGGLPPSLPAACSPRAAWLMQPCVMRHAPSVLAPLGAPLAASTPSHGSGGCGWRSSMSRC